MFKSKLKENRLRLGLTQKQLAERIFVSREAVSKWEQGRGLPEKESLQRLAELFGVAEGALLTEDDLHEAVDENASDAEKSRRRLFVFSIIASILVTALASALIAFAFIYHAMSWASEETYTLIDVEMSEDSEGKKSLVRLSGENSKGRSTFSSASFKETSFYDETGSYLKDPWSKMALRKDDVFKLVGVETAQKNLYGRAKNNSLVIRSFYLVSHPFEQAQFLYGVGLHIGDDNSFSPTGDNSAFAAYCLTDPTGSHLISEEANNLSDFSVNFLYSDEPGKGKVTTSFTVCLDPEKTGDKFFTYDFLGGTGHWTVTYHDFVNNKDLAPQRTSLSVGSVSAAFVGINDLLRSDGHYDYDQWTITVKMKKNPSRYHVAFYDANSTILSQSDVHSLAEASALSLPDTRDFALVSEYGPTGTFVARTTVDKGKDFPFAFSNAYGIFPTNHSRVAL